MTAAVLRAVLVTNALLLVALGAIYALWAERPGGMVLAAALWGGAAVLLSLLGRLREGT